MTSGIIRSLMLKFDSRLISPPAWFTIALFCVLASEPAHAQTNDTNDTDLLAGKAPVSSKGISRADQLTDGRVAHEGDFWLTDITTRFNDEHAYAIFDLGGPQPIRCVFLQGDNNDFYQVDGSVNGDKFFPMYIGAPTDGPGLRLRAAKIVATARFVRVHAHGGDGSYSLAEVNVLRRCPTPWPPDLARLSGTEIVDNLYAWIGVVGAIAVAAFLFFRGQRRKSAAPEAP